MKNLQSDKVIYEFDQTHEPALRISSGETFNLETQDCFSNQIRSEDDKIGSIDLHHVNPATGPVYVEGAMPGDVLKVTIHEINVADQGFTVVTPGMGQTGHLIKEETSKLIKVEGDHIVFKHIKLPLRKMVGVIGTTPKEKIATGWAGLHGGNMDCTRVSPGAVVYLPVYVEGALFAAGDIHAAMGDGEVGISGVEICGNITFTIDVLKNCDLPSPSIHSGNRWSLVRVASDADEAIHNVVNDTIKYMAKAQNLTLEEATILASDAFDVVGCSTTGEDFTVIRYEVPEQLVKLP